jgi:hypothetical protein
MEMSWTSVMCPFALILAFMLSEAIHLYVYPGCTFRCIFRSVLLMRVLDVRGCGTEM